MKKIFLMTLAASAVLFSAPAKAQKKLSEGKITYEISFPGMQIDPQQAAMLPTESITYIKGDKSRSEQKMGMGMSQVVISDSKANSAVILMDMMGNKTAIKMTAAEMEKGEKEKPQVKVLDETKEIAGYKCKKAEITDSKGNTSQVYFTKDIKGTQGGGKGLFKELDGFPMEFELKQQGMSMKFTVTNVSDEKVDDNLFAVPAGYKEMTLEEFQKSMGGGGMK
jgi:GLPGLI family protein